MRQKEEHRTKKKSGLVTTTYMYANNLHCTQTANTNCRPIMNHVKIILTWPRDYKRNCLET